MRYWRRFFGWFWLVGPGGIWLVGGVFWWERLRTFLRGILRRRLFEAVRGFFFVWSYFGFLVGEFFAGEGEFDFGGRGWGGFVFGPAGFFKAHIFFCGYWVYWEDFWGGGGLVLIERHHFCRSLIIWFRGGFCFGFGEVFLLT